MSNYIDRIEIGREYERLKVQRYGDVNATISKEEILDLTLMAIDSCPTADVVETGRCMNCKHFNEADNQICDYHYASVNSVWFCWAWQERKEE